MKQNRFLAIFSVQQKTGNNRDEYVDFLRGLAMILVLLHHAEVPNGGWILTFHMPLFFILSGYVSSFRKQNQSSFGEYVKKKIFRLVVPYFLFEFLNLIIWVALCVRSETQINIWDAVYAILMCINTEAYTGFYGRLWFWPCLFVSDIFFYLIKRICNEKKALLSASAFVMLVLSWCTSNFLTKRLPFAADTACMATVFIIIGYLFSAPITRIVRQRHIIWDIIIFFLMLLVMRVSVIYGRAFCLMYINSYGPFLWSLTAALSGSLAFLIISKWVYALLNRIAIGKNTILWYGHNSLAIFPVHLSIKVLCLNLIWSYIVPSGIGIVMRYSEIIMSWYVLFGAMFVFSIPIVNTIMLYFPFMTGVFLQKNKLAQE